MQQASSLLCRNLGDGRGSLHSTATANLEGDRIEAQWRNTLFLCIQLAGLGRDYDLVRGQRVEGMQLTCVARRGLATLQELSQAIEDTGVPLQCWLGFPQICHKKSILLPVCAKTTAQSHGGSMTAREDLGFFISKHGICRLLPSSLRDDPKSAQPSVLSLLCKLVQKVLGLFRVIVCCFCGTTSAVRKVCWRLAKNKAHAAAQCTLQGYGEGIWRLEAWM